MKKRKLLFLLVLVLCFSVILTACTPEEPEEPETPELPEEEVEEKHEMLNWFVLDPEMYDVIWESKVYSSVTQMESNVLGNYPTFLEDGYHYVVEESMNKYNELVKTLTVYKDGASIITKEIKVDYQGDVSREFEVYLVDDYIVVEVGFFSEDEDDEAANETADISVYKVSSTGSVLYQKSGVVDFDTVGNAFFVKTKEKVEWVSENGTVIFSAPADVYDSYGTDPDAVASTEFGGYIYWMSSSKVNVYSPAGASTVEYILTPGAEYLNAFVLDDGNIAVQEFTYLDKWAEAYSTILDGEKVSIATKIINYKTGAVTDVADVNYIIDNLESRYEGENGGYNFPFGIAEGKNNQAYIAYMDKEEAPGFRDIKYVSIDNSLKVQYTVPVAETNFDYWYSDIAVISEDAYIAWLLMGDDYEQYIFDLDGNALVRVSEVSFTKDYLISENAVYDWNMNLVYDFDINKVYWDYVIIGDRIVVSKDANYDGYYESYFLDPATGALTAIDDGLTTELVEGGWNNYYIVGEYCDACIAHINNCDSADGDCCESCAPCYNCKLTLYNINGTVLITARGDMEIYDDEGPDGQLVVVTEFEGNSVWYVIE